MNLNCIRRIWSDLDVATVSEKAASTVNSVKTIDTNLGDHRSKIYGLRLAKKFENSWKMR